MKVNQQPQIINSRNISNNDVNFKGFNAFKIFSSSKDKLTLSQETRFNKEALDWLNQRFKKFGKDSINKAYEACLNFDSNASEPAINLLKKFTPNEDKKRLFSRQPKKDDVFSKFGLDFLSCMLQASKNDEQNHKKENLDFLDKVLSKYKSKPPTKYLDIIVNSKDDDGNIDPKAEHLFDFFVQKDNIGGFAAFMRHLKALPSEEQLFIGKYYTKLKDNHILFQILKEADGQDSAKIIKAVDSDLKTFDAGTILNCIKEADTPKKTAKGIVDGDASLENYQKLINFLKNDKKMFDWTRHLKDNNGLIRDENTDFCKSLNKILTKRDSIKNYLEISKDKNGVVVKEFAANLEKVLSENSNPEAYSNIIYCIEKLKNKKGEIQWDFVNIFSSLKNKTDNSVKAEKYKVFDRTLALSRDNNGDIIKDIVALYPSLLKNDLLLEMPNILKISQTNGTFNNDNYKKAFNLIKNTNPDDRYEMSDFLLSCIGKDGNLDNAKVDTLSEIQKRGIASNIVKLANALKNPDNTISQRGLDLAEYLRKNSHHQIEEDLPQIIDSCRDKSGYLNNKNIDTVKSIQKLKPHVQLSKLLDMVLNSQNEVDDNKLKVVTHILKDMKVKDTSTIKRIISAAKDKHGVID